MSLETLSNRQAQHINALSERIRKLEAFPELVARMAKDPELHTEAEDAFLQVGVNLYAGEWREFVEEAALRVGVHYRWELAAAFLLHAGRSARDALETHPITLTQLEQRHGLDVAAYFREAEDGEVLELEDGERTYRYEEHDWLPCWRDLDAPTCETHGIPLQELTHLGSGEASTGCPRCAREAA